MEDLGRHSAEQFNVIGLFNGLFLFFYKHAILEEA